MCPNPRGELADAADEVRIEAFRWSRDLDVEIAGQDLLPKDSPLEISEPVADTTVDAGAVGKMLSPLKTLPATGTE